MFCHVVLFCLVLICKEPSGADGVKPSLADQLNATLSCPAWLSITNVGAKYRNGVTGNKSFTGKDLYVGNNNIKLCLDNKNSVNTKVTDDNASVRHFMVTHLVGCIYVNEVVKLIDFLRIMFQEVLRGIKNLKAVAYRKRQKKLDDAIDAKYAKEPANKASVSVKTETPVQPETSVPQSHEGSEEKNDNQEDRLTDEEHIDFKEPWDTFNFALLLFTDSSTMFDLLFSTMRYLIDSIPSGESFDPYIRQSLDIHVLPCFKIFKDGSRNINVVLREYTGKDDPNYNDKVSSLTTYFIWFLNSHVDLTLQPFLDHFCTVPKRATPSLSREISSFHYIVKRKPTWFDIAHRIEEKIRRLKLKLYNDYYSQLGFLYNFSEQTTSYSIPTTQ